MSRIRIKRFGPIKEGLIENDGYIEFKKLTVFIGNQGSGKSTLAKLFSTFSWIEKALVRGDYDKKWFERKKKFRNQLIRYHRLENYFEVDGTDNAEIEYQGEAASIKYSEGKLSITLLDKQKYSLPQIMYIPAERNFVSYIRNPRETRYASESLQEFIAEFHNAKISMKGSLKLPINNIDLEYDRLNDILNIKGDGDSYKLRLTDACSGFQSFIPLFLVSQYLSSNIKKEKKNSFNSIVHSMNPEELDRFKKGVAQILENNSLTEEQVRVAISVLSSKFNKTAFINIVEEPEQNLFPLSQWKVLESLLNFNNKERSNQLVVTTHSPYLITFISMAMQGYSLFEKIKKHTNSDSLRSKLASVVNIDALVSEADVAIYQLDEAQGTIKMLPSEFGIPSDRNYLNDYLHEGNVLFDRLLEIEQEL